MGAVAENVVCELRRKTRLAIAAGIRPATAAEAALYEATRKRANKSGGKIPFDLTPDDFDVLVSRANNRCEVSGVKFSDRQVPYGPYRYPDLPSVDRLSNSSGYSLVNTRLVTRIVNFSRGSASLLDFQKVMYFSVALAGASVSGGDLLDQSGSPENWQF